MEDPQCLRCQGYFVEELEDEPAAQAPQDTSAAVEIDPFASFASIPFPHQS
eukprot:CAMPEP_0196581634 /NCGR_PEP_ID=MMETSP1081-20130531/34710_1 /TAXON_ID=36882 /ORGANISM="Pyramimonas amylifera, Strain CCMP720" /LENGTH=50 /DNA_ID=CAMNT_0041901937 /DNA_START=80 /DNA_END=228 /DNA_ORIENTATION=+